jgi:cytochrome P450
MIEQTVSSTQALFLALVQYPDVIKEAQAELDAVVGNSRLPTFEDAPKLPYILALIKELLRWHVSGVSSHISKIFAD